MKCSACGGPYHPATGHVHSASVVLCGRCAWDFWYWLKARMGAMHAVLRNRRTGQRMSCSFADCAAKSVIGD